MGNLEQSKPEAGEEDGLGKEDLKFNQGRCRDNPGKTGWGGGRRPNRLCCRILGSVDISRRDSRKFAHFADG